MKKSKIINLFKLTEEAWEKRIAAADISDHPVVKGDIAEKAWRKLLRIYLPSRYRVDSGFVFSYTGDRSEQIDCIIYDNTYTPTFFSDHGLYYIPAEAVYAVLEIKPEVNRCNILYASGKAKSVRSLPRTSAPYVGDGVEKPPKQEFHIIGGLLARKIGGWETQISTLNQILTLNLTNEWLDMLDIVITSEKGSVDYFRGYPDSEPTQENNIIVGVLRLISALQKQGTVPAIDLEEWIRNIKK
ncbi:MAG: DUF6602 domain-containing protein [Gammaproteobacteria bacterium WSBS_2016_MAG_OTU1]